MLLAVDKPHGISSFQAIQKVKLLFPKKTKIGHAGTLDPYATGLLLVGVGEDTKKLTSLVGLSKTYITTIDFMQMTDTRDLDYWNFHQTYTLQDGMKVPSLDQIHAHLTSLIPKKHLPIPPFSAKKIAGKKLYEYARSGILQYEEKEMLVHSYEILSYNFPLLTLVLHVGSGTYIRSIAYWLGKQCDLPGGIVVSLRRKKIGHYDVDQLVRDKEVDGVKYTIIS